MQLIRLHNGGPSDYAVDLLQYSVIRRFQEETGADDLTTLLWLHSRPGIRGASGTLSGYAQTHTIDGWNNKAAWPAQVNPNLALCTVVPDSTKTGATITEANYTGYTRMVVTAATWNAATAGAAGAPTTTGTNGALTGTNCTAGSSVIIGWSLLDSAAVGAGNALWWGSATSTTISTTQTPPTIASGGLTESLL